MINQKPTVRGAFTEPLDEKLKRLQPLTNQDRGLLVFLIHGIRDFGDWQDSLSYNIRHRQPHAQVISVRYGYFNILQFFLLLTRI